MCCFKHGRSTNQLRAQKFVAGAAFSLLAGMNIFQARREGCLTCEFPEETACATAVADAAAAAGVVGGATPAFAAVTAEAEAPALAPVALACQAQQSEHDPVMTSRQA